MWVWLIVLMLVCYGLLGPLLAVVGSSALATITEVRRTGGTEVQLLNVNADLKLIRLSGSCRFKTDTPLSH